jgi:hypothetical protein
MAMMKAWMSPATWMAKTLRVQGMVFETADWWRVRWMDFEKV